MTPETLKADLEAVCISLGYTLTPVVDEKQSLETYGLSSPLILLYQPTFSDNFSQGEQKANIRLAFLTQTSLSDTSVNHFTNGSAMLTLGRQILELFLGNDIFTQVQWLPRRNTNALVCSGYEAVFTVTQIPDEDC
jgi:hypothetical protein